jgi:hypothetical protein
MLSERPHLAYRDGPLTLPLLCNGPFPAAAQRSQELAPLPAEAGRGKVN